MELWIRYIVDFIFSLGLFLNAMLFIPQIMTLYKTKNAEGTSLITFMGFNIMQFFTAWHAYLVQDYLLMFGFIFSLLTCGIVTCLLIKYRVPTPKTQKNPLSH